jgi:hypothetical protein
VLEAALRAPSAHNAQPWRIHLAGGGYALHYDHHEYLPADPEDRDAYLCMARSARPWRWPPPARGWPPRSPWCWPATAPTCTWPTSGWSRRVAGCCAPGVAICAAGFGYHPISVAIDRPETRSAVAALAADAGPEPVALFRIGRPTAAAGASNRVALADILVART